MQLKFSRPLNKLSDLYAQLLGTSLAGAFTLTQYSNRINAGVTFASTVIITLAVLVIKIIINVIIIITIVIIIKPDLQNQGCTIFWLLLSSTSWTWRVGSRLASGEYFIIIIVVNVIGLVFVIAIVIAIVIIIIIP